MDLENIKQFVFDLNNGILDKTDGRDIQRKFGDSLRLFVEEFSVMQAHLSDIEDLLPVDLRMSFNN